MRDPKADGTSTASQLVAQRFPQARAAWLGGSVADGNVTATSDLDVTVLLEGPPAPYRSSEVIDGWPVEFFVQTEESLLDFCAQDRLRRRPTTMRLVGSALVLVDRDGSGRRLQQMLHRMDEAGPPPASSEELDRLRYAVSDLLADLESARSGDEALTVAATLLREIEALDRDHGTLHAEPLLHGLRAAAAHDTGPMREAVRGILDQAGGPLFSGYRVAANSSALVEIRPASADEPGVPELLSLAASDADSALQNYRKDSAAMLLAAIVDGDLVGILGYAADDSAVTVLHIATVARLRRAGVASALLDALCRSVPAGLPIVAETDRDGVEFYAANGFTVTSLGEKYPGVERFAVRI